MKRKFLLGLGSLSILVTVGSVLTTTSCGKTKSDQQLIYEVTSDQILNALNIHSDSQVNASDVPEPKPNDPLLNNVIINEIAGINIEIKADTWKPINSLGELHFNVILSKDGLDPADIAVTSVGWKNGQVKPIPDTGLPVINKILNDSKLSDDGDKTAYINDTTYGLQDKEQWDKSLTTIGTLIKNVKDSSGTTPAPIGVSGSTENPATIDSSTKIGVDANAFADALAKNNLAIADVIFHKGTQWLQASFITRSTSKEDFINSNSLESSSAKEDLIEGLLNKNSSDLASYSSPEIQYYNAAALKAKANAQTSKHMIVEFELVDKKVNSQLMITSRVSFLDADIKTKGINVDSVPTSDSPALYHW
ncbi:MAG: hypothetical protein NC236_01065 [Mycoplasma sp.]|nr:hypothetical protein [Mycoplasma sp.]